MKKEESHIQNSIDRITEIQHRLRSEIVEKQHNPIPTLFFVVESSEESWKQISVGLKTYEKATEFKDSKHNKKYHPNAFIVASFN